MFAFGVLGFRDFSSLPPSPTSLRVKLRRVEKLRRAVEN